MRIRITKDHKLHKKGDVLEVSRNEAFGLIDSGFAIVSKDITEKDIEVKDGKPTQLRSHKSR